MAAEKMKWSDVCKVLMCKVYKVLKSYTNVAVLTDFNEVCAEADE